MITAYVPINGRLEKREIAHGDPVPTAAVWIDLFEPVRDEETAIETAFALEIPTREEMQEIEVSSRLYREGEALFLTTSILSYADTPNPVSSAVTFILTRSTLITLRYATPKPFTTFSARLLRQSALATTGALALVGLLDAVVDRLADVLEYVVADLEHMSGAIFRGRDGTVHASAQKASKDLRDLLQAIGRDGDLLSKARDSLLGLSRLVTFALETESDWLEREIHNRLKALGRDIRSLSEHAAFISSNITFLLDATLGLVNVEQNNIIKIFSVAAVGMMPPTLIASMYGMNFHNMPELDWPFGYPLALLLMVISAIVPYLYFKKRGWL